ncbi:MAG: hypothetical protein H7Y17_14960 [Chlorobia bacterium]|nr:hypothetical protein [Fimbriimonadaceae bacterium]
MRKRWVWIGVAATALILAVFALLPRQPDGLDFIRKYGPQSERYEEEPAWMNLDPRRSGQGTWSKVFKFQDIPPSLASEMRELEAKDGMHEMRKSFEHKDMSSMHFDLPSSKKAVYFPNSNLIVVYDVPGPSWLSLQ